MIATCKPIPKGTKVRLHDAIGLCPDWDFVIGEIVHAFIIDEEIMYVIRLHTPAVHPSGARINCITAHADNIRIL